MSYNFFAGTVTLPSSNTLISEMLEMATSKSVPIKRTLSFPSDSNKTLERIGSVVLRNVSCAVSPTDNGALLFGQSALKRFKKYRINNQKRTLEVWQ